MTEAPAGADVVTATVAAKTPTKRALREMTKPFLAKEPDLQVLHLRLGELNNVIFDHPETATTIADMLGFNKSLVSSISKGKKPENDPRLVFEEMAYDDFEGKDLPRYYPGVLSGLLTIISNGMKRPDAEKVLKSMFSRSAKKNFETLNMILGAHSYMPTLRTMPSWVKGVMAPYQKGLPGNYSQIPSTPAAR